MSILKVDKALQQDDDALITTSTKDSDPDNAVVTKDYLKKSLAGFKPQNDLDLNKLDERYARRPDYDLRNHTVKFFISSKSKPFANEPMVGSPWIDQNGDKIITNSLYVDVNNSVLSYTDTSSGVGDKYGISTYIDPRHIGADYQDSVVLSTSKVPDTTNPGHYIITNHTGIVVAPGSWLRPFSSYEGAYRAAVLLQERSGVKYNFIFCFCLDDYEEPANEYVEYGHSSIMPGPAYRSPLYGDDVSGWASSGNSNNEIVVDARPFRSLMFKSFYYQYKDGKVTGVVESSSYSFKPDYYTNSTDNKDNIVSMFTKKPEGDNRYLLSTNRHSMATQLTPPSLFVYGHLILDYNFAWAIMNIHGDSRDDTSVQRLEPMSLTAPEKGGRSSYLHIMDNSTLEINDSISDINHLRSFRDRHYSSSTARLFFFNNTPGMDAHGINPAYVGNLSDKTFHGSVIDVGKNGRIIGKDGLEVYIATANSKRVSDLALARTVLMSDKVAMSYLYLDKGAMINLPKLSIDDPYYYHTPTPSEHNKVVPDFSLITMDSNSNFGNTGLYFTHFPADLMYRATQGDNDAKSYIATQNMWTSLDSSKLYPSYSSNTNPNKLLKDVHRRVLTWRGPIDFNYDAVHYEIPKETTGNTYPARWSRSLAFHRSKDCGATGTIQYPQKTYMWNILHNPHLDTNSQYGNADSMWNIYLPNILGGDICMVETYDDWLYGAKLVPDAWHMYASEIWVDV
jgi:hypothetical protein|nr:MAG TPA: hypothetical protein [Caudoviricetes sp.]